MKRNLKSFIIAALVFAVPFLLMGNGKQEESKETIPADEYTGANPVSDAPVTFSVLYGGMYNEDWLLWDLVEEKTNVTFDAQVVAVSDYAQKRTIVLNSGKIPDFMVRTMPSDVTNYVSSGIILPISDYFDRLPNMTAYFDKNDYWSDIKAYSEADGKLYSLPCNSSPSRYVSHNWLIRMDLLEKYGLDVPETMDDVYDVAMKFKEEMPGVYPFTNRFGSGNILSKFASAFNTQAGWGLDTMFQYDPEGDNFYFAPTSEDYYDFLKWSRKLYVDELLDPEFSTLDTNVYEERAVNSQNLIFVDWVNNEKRYNAQGRELTPGFNVQPMLPPKGPEGYYSGGKIAKYKMGWVISSELAEDERFGAFLRFVDWMYTEEGALAATFGRVGESCVLGDDGKYKFKNPNIENHEEYGIFNNEMTLCYHDDLNAALYDEYVSGLIEEMNDKGVYRSLDPSPKFDEATKEKIKIYDNTLRDYVNQMMEKFVFGEASLDDWNEYVSECESKGSLKLRDIYNEVYRDQN